ncbi:DNA-binding MarR family transcriptional regulator [Arthrobacter sp. CAN_A2]|uniref:MarR family winged helix-turn-helix transcriptional regulator n=1 Tax=Arthrobacter sp. CAN_A2 TaxID=2787718 RepID=UPI0018F032A8
MDPHKTPDRQKDVSAKLRRFSSVSGDLSRAFGTRYGMHHTAARAVMELMEAARRGTPLTSGQLGDLLDLTPASVTALVDRMLAAGHVRREPDPTDRRRVLLIVEPAAVQLGHEFFQPLAADLSVMMSDYDDAQLELIDRFLRDSTAVVLKHLARTG